MPGRPGLPGSTVIHSFPTQRSLAAPVQVRPSAHASKKRELDTVYQCAMRKVQGTQRAGDRSAFQKSLQVALADLASDLGVSDYNINPTHFQQSVSTQFLQHSQLVPQAKEIQRGETHHGSTLATAQMRPGLRQLNPKSEDSVAAMQKAQSTQALCVLNSHSSLPPK
jgi:hypothetical protein